MKSSASHVVFVAFLLTTPTFMKATILGTQELSGFGFEVPGVQPPQFGLQFTLAGDATSACWGPGPACPVILDETLTTADIGSVYSFGPSSQNFGTVQGFLTDGAPGDEWCFAPDTNAGGAVSQNVSGMLPPGLPDFVGDTLSDIDLTINNIAFSQILLPGGDPLTLQTYTQTTFDVTITVQGETPEPPSGLTIVSVLFFGGALYVVGKFRQRFRGSEK